MFFDEKINNVREYMLCEKITITVIKGSFMRVLKLNKYLAGRPA